MWTRLLFQPIRKKNCPVLCEAYWTGPGTEIVLSPATNGLLMQTVEESIRSAYVSSTHESHAFNPC